MRSGLPTTSAPACCSARSGMLGTMQLATSWTKPSPPASRICFKPSEPSFPMPVSTTPIADGSVRFGGGRHGDVDRRPVEVFGGRRLKMDTAVRLDQQVHRTWSHEHQAGFDTVAFLGDAHGHFRASFQLRGERRGEARGQVLDDDTGRGEIRRQLGDEFADRTRSARRGADDHDAGGAERSDRTSGRSRPVPAAARWPARLQASSAGPDAPLQRL